MDLPHILALVGVNLWMGFAIYTFVKTFDDRTLQSRHERMWRGAWAKKFPWAFNHYRDLESFKRTLRLNAIVVGPLFIFIYVQWMRHIFSGKPL